MLNWVNFINLSILWKVWIKLNRWNLEFSASVSGVVKKKYVQMLCWPNFKLVPKMSMHLILFNRSNIQINNHGYFAADGSIIYFFIKRQRRFTKDLLKPVNDRGEEKGLATNKLLNSVYSHEMGRHLTIQVRPKLMRVLRISYNRK